MANRFEYQFKKYRTGKRRGQEYVNIISVKTGKTIKTFSSKTRLKTAHRSAKQQMRRQSDAKYDRELRSIAKYHRVSYESVKERYETQIDVEKGIEAARVKELRKQGKKPHGRKLKKIKKSILQKLEETSGYITTYRLYWVVQDGTDSPYIAAQGAGVYMGDQMDKAIKYVKHYSLPIIERAKGDKDYVILKGSNSGACVKLIDRETQDCIDAYQLGIGCSRV